MKHLKSLEDEILEHVKSPSNWSHDIRKIGEEYVEEVVLRYQRERNFKDLAEIINNYAIFRVRPWGIAFAQYLNKDVEAGAHLHDEIIWFAAINFESAQKRKPNGRAFNAYLVSCLMNQLKNFNNISVSSKSIPRITCHVCGQRLSHIDKKHLEHRFDLKLYKQKFPGYSVVSTDGLVHCPETKSYVGKIDDKSLRGLPTRKRGARCPVTGMTMNALPKRYPSMLLKGYTASKLASDFSGWKRDADPRSFDLRHADYLSFIRGGRIRKRKAKCESLYAFQKMYPQITMEARQVAVVNPYTGKRVPEITLAMLRKAGVTLSEHIQNYATIWLDKKYQYPVKCPFTGRKAHVIRTKDLVKIGRTEMEFYMAVCKYPLRKYQVKCALCGKWTENIWDHLDSAPHYYAESYSMEEFERAFGFGKTKLGVSTNAYVESESGECVFIADLLPGLSMGQGSQFEIEDSLTSAAKDELDRKIARAAPTCLSLDDLYHIFCRRVWTRGRSISSLRKAVGAEIGTDDFDIECPKERGCFVDIISPRKITIRQRLEALIQNSDLVDEQPGRISGRHSTQGPGPGWAGIHEATSRSHAVEAQGKRVLQGQGN